MSITSIALPLKDMQITSSFPSNYVLEKKEMSDFIFRTGVQNKSQFDPSSSNVEAESHFTSPTQSLRNTKEYQ
ncbi:hypothetical protein GEMRC1_009987 [Eukaryota sp. GEM-RC1]